MPPLLEKFRFLNRERHRPPARAGKDWKPKPGRPLKRDWVFWGSVVLVVAAVLGLYFWTTTARILQDPLRLEYGPGDPKFASALGPVVGAEFTAGNTVETLVNGVRFFPAMLDAIHQAKATITLETYIWSPGVISDQFIDALGAAAQRGVQVLVLVDGMGTLKFRGPDRERLEKSGVKVVKYGREHWWEVKPNINHRTHRKLLIVDGKVGFTGGMCIDDRWLGDADAPDRWRETVVRVEGPVVRQMQAVFAANWLRTTSRLILGEGYFPTARSRGEVVSHCFMSGPSEGPQHARLAHLFAIAGARRTIDIGHAYFVPDDLAIDMLLEARRRGVRVRVIVPETSDSAFGRAASRSRWSRLLEGGVEFHLYRDSLFHCKSMVVDGTLVTLGSANFDNRSFAINDEVTINLLDPKVGAEHTRIFEQDLKRTVPLTAEQFAARPFYIKAGDWFAGLFRSQF